MAQGFNQDSEKPSSETPVINPKKEQQENPWIEGVKTVATAAILAIGIRTFVAEARYIPSSSMEPTLQINDRLIIEKVGYHFQDPQRGDIVVFRPTQALRQKDFKEAFIKRVIGVPGDTIKVHNGVVYVNDQPLKENYIAQKPDYEFGPVTVPSGQYLVLGDNRNNSYDSHYWGFVPKENLIGRAMVRFWPLNRVGGIEEPVYNLKTP